MKSLLRPRSLLAALAGLFLLHAGYLYYQVGTGIARDAWDVPSILYGRPAVIRPGDPVDNLRLPERLRRLSYQKVPGVPETPGTWSEEPDRIRIHTRGVAGGDAPRPGVRAAIGIAERRVASLETSSGAPLEELILEPEEIARILGPKMESRRLVPLAAVPKHLQDAVLAAEDSRFYTHFGIDFVGVLRALMTNLRRMRIVQGGSTITQQLAKNFFLSPKRSIWRKIREAELAIIIEFRFSKEEIFQAYLNKIYFGQEGPRGIYGVEDAANFYFSRSVGELTLEEAALLAGIIRSPHRYSPLRMADAARNRRNWVLSRMAALGMISRNEEDRARLTPLRTNPRRVPVGIAEYYVDYIERAAEESLGAGRLSRTGYRFYTSLDPGHQSAAEKAVAEGLAELGRRTIPAGGDREPLQAALVAVDPATGELTAMVGGRGYAETQFNRAADARRQPGSAFKPFVLLAAMEQAVRGKGTVTLASRISGEPLSLETPDGIWTPANFEGKEYGEISIRRMIEESVNTGAVRLSQEVGLPGVIAAAREAGIENPITPVPSLSLGSFEVTPVELAYAYATIASGGTRFRPFTLRAVTDSEGNLLREENPVREQTVDPRAAFLVTYALEGVLDRGTGHAARLAGVDFPAAGKTGTTDAYRDSWFAGYTPDLVCVVWVGRDTGGPTGLTGSSGALRIWTKFMKSVYPAGGRASFRVPPGITMAEIDPESGYLATSACPQPFPEAFPDDLVPRETCPLHPSHPLVDTMRKGWRGLRDFLDSLFR
ncbi:MAG: PBP1A family penicillin-binding protein [Deltaproteobacteria bacterium]|nr:MAG: PBP1A family penicillin-binding protein [Deltaproteobacteria bacterium]